MSRIKVVIYPKIKDWSITISKYYDLNSIVAEIILQVKEDTSFKVKKSFKNIIKASEWVEKICNGEIQVSEDDL